MPPDFDILERSLYCGIVMTAPRTRERFVALTNAISQTWPVAGRWFDCLKLSPGSVLCKGGSGKGVDRCSDQVLGQGSLLVEDRSDAVL